MMTTQPFLPRVSINHLPNEILAKIFWELPVQDLLKNCRLVSKLWNHIAALKCRHNLVHFKGNASFEAVPICIFETFLDVANLPWSSVDLNLYSGYQSARVSRQIAQRFGPQIQSLNLYFSHFTYGDPLELFRLMPNLEMLQMEAQAATETPSSPPPPLDLQCESGVLKKLKQLTLRFATRDERHSQSIDFLEFVLHNTRLKVLEILLTRHIPEKEFMQAVELFPHAQNLHLKIAYFGPDDRWQFLASTYHANLQQLCLAFPEKNNIDDNYFGTLENFLGNCTSLLTLNLLGFGSSKHVSPHKLLNIPELPKLKALRITFNNNRPHDTKPKMPYLYFHPIRPSHVPSLGTVTIDQSHSTVESFTIEIQRVFAASDNGANFESVKRLDIKYYNVGGYDKLFTLFPKLIQFSATVTDIRGMQDVCAHVRNLEQFNLNLCTVADVNWILFETVRNLPIFEGVRKLHVVNSNTENTEDKILKDSGAILFSLIDPVHLTIRNAQLSDTCISQLSHRHKSFQLL